MHKKTVTNLFSTLLIILMIASARAEEGKFDKFGGWQGIKGKTTGVFHTEEINGRWWIITPAGNAFWSTGMYCVRMGGIPDTNTGKRAYQEACVQKYGNEAEWARVTRLRLHDWGFNTIGDWSAESIYHEPGFAYVIGINLAKKTENVIPKGAYGYFPDVFSEQFRESTDEQMKEVFSGQPYLTDDPWLLGYFLADEPAWYGSKGRRGSLSDDFIVLDNSRAGKKAWNEFIKTKYGKDNPGTEQDKLEFLKVISGQFGKVLTETLRKYDKYHMVLGTRPTRTYPEVLQGLSPYCDIFSIGAYDLNQGNRIDPKFEETINEIYANTKKPIMLGVLIAGQDTGLPYGIVKTQKDRGISYWRYFAKVAANPVVVGIHWFQYFDPPLKCYDAQAANWGLVNEKDEPYQEAVSLIAQANKMVYAYALGLTNFAPEFDGLFGLKKEKMPEEVKEPGKTVPLEIKDAGFEPGGKAWSMQTWKGKSRASIDLFQKHSGLASLKIQGGPDEGWGSVGVGLQWKPTFTLKPGYQYKLSAWIKTKDVENSAFVRIKIKYSNAEEAYFATENAYGTGDWKKAEVKFSPREENSVEYLGAQLVGKGTVWFDDISLELIQ